MKYRLITKTQVILKIKNLKAKLHKYLKKKQNYYE